MGLGLIARFLKAVPFALAGNERVVNDDEWIFLNYINFIWLLVSHFEIGRIAEFSGIKISI